MTEAVRPEGEPPLEAEAEDRAETLREDILAGPDELAAVLDRHGAPPRRCRRRSSSTRAGA